MRLHMACVITWVIGSIYIPRIPTGPMHPGENSNAILEFLPIFSADISILPVIRDVQWNCERVPQHDALPGSEHVVNVITTRVMPYPSLYYELLLTQKISRVPSPVVLCIVLMTFNRPPGEFQGKKRFLKRLISLKKKVKKRFSNHRIKPLKYADRLKGTLCGQS